MPSMAIPPPSPPERLLLIARWVERLNNVPGADRQRLRHAYTLAIRPDEEIASGRLVKILAVSTIAAHTPNRAPGLYDTYDPHIKGWIEDVWTTKDGMGRARVINVCQKNRVAEIELDFPYLLAAHAHKPERAPKKGTEAELVGMGLDTITRILPATTIADECLGADCMPSPPLLY
ncbi:hypothetical protein OH76DRAFT_1421021 [Lentinus brumalis]|uniref:Uncharacterized protein n=1 Tax=Lentinus brumalis TaxID=2498619 RepID=A0A371CXN5_9APHY|nr:hypothetical protein OH76DRAFT_1421021 [Polyporus brumalis]